MSHSRSLCDWIVRAIECVANVALQQCLCSLSARVRGAGERTELPLTSIFIHGSTRWRGPSGSCSILKATCTALPSTGPA